MPGFLGTQYAQKGGNAALQNRYNKLVQNATYHGVQQRPEGEVDDPGFWMKSIEFLSRPVFATTGLAEIVAARTGFLDNPEAAEESIGGRVFSELIGQGQKQFAGDVLEEGGVGDKPLFEALGIDGESWLRTHWDPGLRGTAGLTWDIFLDPLTYIGLGPLKKGASVVTRGGRAVLSPKASLALGKELDRGTAILAKRLGRLKHTSSGGTAITRAAAGAEAEQLWWGAVNKGGRDKARVFAQIEVEAHERGLMMSKSIADGQQYATTLAETVRKRADSAIRRVLEGTSNVDETKRVLQNAGLNPEAANIARETAKLVQPNVVSYWIPFKGKVKLFELGKTGTASRLAHGIVDPFTKKFIGLLESRETTKAFLHGARRAGLDTVRAVDKMFNPHALNARKIPEYIDEVMQFKLSRQQSMGRLQDKAAKVFTDIAKHKDVSEQFLRTISDPTRENWNRLYTMADNVNLSKDYLQEAYVTWNTDMKMWAAADIGNQILDPAAAERYRGRYAPLMADGWDEVDEQTRTLIIDWTQNKSKGREPVANINLGSFNEHRISENLDEYIEAINKINAKFKVNLRPNLDPHELYIRRGHATVEAAELTNFFNRVKGKFGRNVGAEGAGILGAILPDLQAMLKPGELDGKTITTLNDLLSRTTSVGDAQTFDSFLGINIATHTDEAVAAGMPQEIADYLKWVRKNFGGGTNTSVEFVDQLRGAVLENEKVLAVTGATRMKLAGDIAEVQIRLYKGAEIDTIAKEWGRRGWAYLTADERATFSKYFKETGEKLTDPSTGKAFTDVADAFSQEFSDWSIGKFAASADNNAVSRAMQKLSSVMQSIVARAKEIQARITGRAAGDDVGALFEKTLAGDTAGLDLSGLSASERIQRFGIEGLQRQTLGEGIEAKTGGLAQRIRQLGAEEFNKLPAVEQAKILEAQARELSTGAATARGTRTAAKAAKLEFKKGKSKEQLNLAERRAQRHRDAAIAKRDKLNQKELKKLDEIFAEEERAILAENIEVRLDPFGDQVDTGDLARVTDAQVKKLHRRRGQIVSRARKEIGEHAAAAAEALARQREFNVDVARIKYAGQSFTDEISRVTAEGVTANELAQSRRIQAAELRAEAAELREGQVRRKPKEIREADAAALRALPQNAQSAFMYQSLLHVNSIEHLQAILTKYEDVFLDIAPEALAKARGVLDDSILEAKLSPYGAFGGQMQAYKPVSVRVGGKDHKFEVPSGIAEDLEKWDEKLLDTEEVKHLLSIFDWMTNTFKRAVTIPFPAFHFRNLYSNVFQSALDITLQAFNPRRHAEAIGVLLGGTPAGRKLGMSEITIVDKFGNHWTGSQLRGLMDAHQIKVDYNELFEIIQGKRKMEKIAGSETIRRLRSLAEGAGPAIETEARAMHFITLIRRGYTPAEAAMQVKKYLFDYGALSLTEKQIMRRIIPFYTWQSKNIRLQIHAMATQPGKVLNFQKALLANQGPDQDMLPEYVRGDLQVRLEPGQGKEARFLTGIDLPAQNVDMIFAGSWEKTLRNNLSMINPLIKAPLELAFNMESFSGRPIAGQQYMSKFGPLLQKFPKPLQEYFNLKTTVAEDGSSRYTANGTKVYVWFKAWALSRFMGTAADFAKMTQSDEAVYDWWKIMTSLTIREFDLSEKQRTMMRARYNQLEKEMIKRGLYRKLSISIPSAETAPTTPKKLGFAR